jgi:hypothetical protein
MSLISKYKNLAQKNAIDNHRFKLTASTNRQVSLWAIVIYRIDNLQEGNWPVNEVGTVLPVAVNNECYI